MTALAGTERARNTASSWAVLSTSHRPSPHRTKPTASGHRTAPQPAPRQRDPLPSAAGTSPRAVPAPAPAPHPRLRTALTTMLAPGAPPVHSLLRLITAPLSFSSGSGPPISPAAHPVTASTPSPGEAATLVRHQLPVRQTPAARRARNAQNTSRADPA